MRQSTRLAIASAMILLMVSTQAMATRYLAYITRFASNAVTVFDLTERQCITSIPVGSGPLGIDATPDGSQIYVGNFSDGTLSRINGFDLNATPVTLQAGVGIRDVDVTGTWVATANRDANSVTIININNGQNRTFFPPLNSGPSGVAVSGNIVLTANVFGNSISVFDLSVLNPTIFTYTNVGAGPVDAKFPDNSGSAVVAIQNSNTFLRAAPAGGGAVLNLAGPFPTGFRPQSVGVRPNSDFVYISSDGLQGNSQVNRVDQTINNSLSLDIGERSAKRVAFSGDGSIGIITFDEDGEFGIIDGPTNTLVETCGGFGGGTPWGVTVARDPERFFVGTFEAPATGCTCP